MDFVPAIREIRKGEINVNDFSGINLIDQLAKLERPSHDKQNLKEQFNKINKFLQCVTNNETATLEIPYERDTITVHMDKKSLPLESLGTGIHEVVIIAAAATILQNQASEMSKDQLVCIEEPEIHLHPHLQKQLVNYLKENTTNQYFISTHSAHIIDTPESAVFHVRYENGQTFVKNVTTDIEKSHICADLGYRASDLLQTNCIIWVEGPSDRIYLNYWIRSKDENLIEGLHYSIMFYGGRLRSHITANEQEGIEEFISLRRLNRYIAIIIDSDLADSEKDINSTTKRLRKEFNKEDGFAWLTKGREIENYIDPDVMKKVVKNINPKVLPKLKFDIYDNCLKYKNDNGNVCTVDKVKVAKEVTKHPVNFEILDLERRMKLLINFIKKSNGISVD